MRECTGIPPFRKVVSCNCLDRREESCLTQLSGGWDPRGDGDDTGTAAAPGADGPAAPVRPAPERPAGPRPPRVAVPVLRPGRTGPRRPSAVPAGTGRTVGPGEEHRQPPGRRPGTQGPAAPRTRPRQPADLPAAPHRTGPPGPRPPRRTVPAALRPVERGHDPR